MMNLFANSSSNWVKYDKYEWKKADNGTLYITPTEDAKPKTFPIARNVTVFRSYC